MIQFAQSCQEFWVNFKGFQLVFSPKPSCRNQLAESNLPKATCWKQLAETFSNLEFQPCEFLPAAIFCLYPNCICFANPAEAHVDNWPGIRRQNCFHQPKKRSELEVWWSKCLPGRSQGSQEWPKRGHWSLKREFEHHLGCFGGGFEVSQRLPSEAKSDLKAIPGNFYRHRVLCPIVHWFLLNLDVILECLMPGKSCSCPGETHIFGKFVFCHVASFSIANWIQKRFVWTLKMHVMQWQIPIMLRLVGLVAQVVWEPEKHCQKTPSGRGDTCSGPRSTPRAGGRGY